MAAGLKRPLTVTFVLRPGEDPEEVIDVLWATFGQNCVRGLYCDPFRTSKVNCTLRDELVVKKVLEAKSFKFHGRDIIVTEVDVTTVWVTVSGVPIEMGDASVVTALSQYGKVVGGVVREKWRKKLSVEKGVRRLQMIMQKPVPNFLRIGSFDLMVSYKGLVRVCRRCGSEEHLASACTKRRCLNCDSEGHLAAKCVEKCKKCGGAHSLFDCPTKSYASVAASLGAQQDPITPMEEVTTEVSTTLVTDVPSVTVEGQPTDNETPPSDPSKESTVTPSDASDPGIPPESSPAATSSTTAGEITATPPVDKNRKKKKKPRKVPAGENAVVNDLIDVGNPDDITGSGISDGDFSDGLVVDESDQHETVDMDTDVTRKRPRHIPEGVEAACALATQVTTLKKVKQ